MIKKHRHKWKMTKQVTVGFGTYHNYYKCECGKKKNDYEGFGKKFKLK